MIFSVVDITGREFCVFQYLGKLVPFQPEVGGGDFNVHLLCGSEDAVLSLTHGLLPVFFWQVLDSPWIDKICQSDPDNLVVILEGSAGQGLEIVAVSFG